MINNRSSSENFCRLILWKWWTQAWFPTGWIFRKVACDCRGLNLELQGRSLVSNTQVLTGAFIDRLKLSRIQFYPVLWKIQVCIEDVKPHSDRRGNLWKWRWDIRYVCRHFDRKDWSKTFRSRSAKSFLLMKRAFQRSSCQFTTKKKWGIKMSTI